MSTKETKRITVEGGLVRMERIVIEREAKAEDFMAEVARMQPLDSGLLPEGCVAVRRWCDESKVTQSLYLIERAVGLQPIKFRPGKGGEEERALVLSWPRTVWCCRTLQAPAADIVSMGDCAVAVVKEPIREKGLATKLFRLPMPNLYEDGNGAVCTGSIQLHEHEATAAEKVSHLIRQVMESAWNEDLMPDFKGLGIDGLEDWASKSSADPEFHAKIAYRTHNAGTVGGLLEELTRRP
ncbi:MAG: hypothetical protein L6Q38_07095 [Nitrospira sp.]|nr:hypothetical protein [Nitrospira sp.]